MNMPQVSSCSAGQCAYNAENSCHAIAITVTGESSNCGTFTSANIEGGEPEIIAGVGACKMSSCKYNEHLECQAESVEIGKDGEHVYCKTYTMQ